MANNSDTPAGGNFKRSYVACLGCRSRKVRCVMEAEPPCVRCKREHRECTFKNQEKTYKGRHPPKWVQRSESREHRDKIDEAGQIPRRQDSLPGHDAHHAHGSLQSVNNGHGDDQRSPVLESVMSDRMISSVTVNSADTLNLLFDSTRVMQPPRRQGGAILPEVIRSIEGTGFTISTLSDPEDDILDMWDRCRFVRQGWFTAQEAVTYVDLFHEKVSPLSPIDLKEFRAHSAHQKLVCEEAMLCCTILMISSRLFTLPGAGGVSRSHNNHRRLWNYCELLLKRVIMGQEKHSTSKIRVLGSVESLLLISDWPPRAINFPPETEGFDKDLISPYYDRLNRRQYDENAPLIRWREDVFEPANRAEKMTWMLLGVATNLAHELKVFSDKPFRHNNLEDARKWRLRKLLYIYNTQASTRMRIPSTLPDQISQSVTASPPPGIQDRHTRDWAVFMNLWIELTRLSATAAAMFFQSASHTKTQLLNGSYVPLLEHLLSSMKQWHERAISSAAPEPLKTSLLLEYYHIRACSAAVAVQAVVEKAAVANSEAATSNLDTIFTGSTSFHDAKFLKEVANDAGTVLRLASLTDFKEHLPYVPTRLRVFVVSSSVFLLKAVGVGSKNADSAPVLTILEQSSRALQQLAPDDMCFASRSAMLIEKQTARLRNSLVPSREMNDLPSLARHSTDSEAQNTVDQQPFDFTDVPGGLNQAGDQYALNDMMDFDGLDPSTLDTEADAWMSLPYDYGMAPFNTGSDIMSFGVELDSLDFLWNLGG